METKNTSKLVKPLYFLTLLLFSSCMALPEQPPLTESENNYYNKLMSDLNCRVDRDINPFAVLNSKGQAESTRKQREKGWYLLNFQYKECSEIPGRDSMYFTAKRVAHKLHTQVLAKGFNYRYENISITFSCFKGNPNAIYTPASYEFNYSR